MFKHTCLCVRWETQTHTHNGVKGVGVGVGVVGLYWWWWWWWCKAVTEIEGDGVAAAGCSVHCQSGMINEWRPQLSLTFGEPHRTSAELSALWQGQSWTTNYFAITKVGCQLNPSHSLRQGQANFSFTYTHTDTHIKRRPQSCVDMRTYTQTKEQTGQHVQEHIDTWTHTQSGRVNWYEHICNHALRYTRTWTK